MQSPLPLHKQLSTFAAICSNDKLRLHRQRSRDAPQITKKKKAKRNSRSQVNSTWKFVSALEFAKFIVLDFPLNVVGKNTSLCYSRNIHFALCHRLVLSAHAIDSKHIVLFPLSQFQSCCCTFRKTTFSLFSGSGEYSTYCNRTLSKYTSPIRLGRNAMVLYESHEQQHQQNARMINTRSFASTAAACCCYLFVLSICFLFTKLSRA